MIWSIKIAWYKNGSILPASNRYNTNFDIKTGVASLKINEAQPNDSGPYDVVVENVAGRDRTNANLIVDNSPSIDKSPIVDPSAFRYLNQPQTPTHKPNELADASKMSPPKVVIPLKDVRVNEGQPATLITKIIGYPIPNVISTFHLIFLLNNYNELDLFFNMNR